MMAGSLAGTFAGAGELVLAGSGETLTAQVAEAEAIFVHGRPSVRFALEAAAAGAMAELTGRTVGQDLTVSLCGHALIRATVRERISGRGIVNLPTTEAAFAVAEVLNGKADCAVLDPHLDQ